MKVINYGYYESLLKKFQSKIILTEYSKNYGKYPYYMTVCMNKSEGLVSIKKFAGDSLYNCRENALQYLSDKKLNINLEEQFFRKDELYEMYGETVIDYLINYIAKHHADDEFLTLMLLETNYNLNRAKTENFENKLHEKTPEIIGVRIAIANNFISTMDECLIVSEIETYIDGSFFNPNNFYYDDFMNLATITIATYYNYVENDDDYSSHNSFCPACGDEIPCGCNYELNQL